MRLTESSNRCDNFFILKPKEPLAPCSRSSTLNCNECKYDNLQGVQYKYKGGDKEAAAILACFDSGVVTKIGDGGYKNWDFSGELSSSSCLVNSPMAELQMAGSDPILLSLQLTKSETYSSLFCLHFAVLGCT